jgi:hypothetical protein
MMSPPGWPRHFRDTAVSHAPHPMSRLNEVAEELNPPVIPMQTGMAEAPTVHGPKAFLASNDRHAGIKKDE